MENQARQTAQQKADFLKKEICLLLNWTEMQFADYQYKCGIAYLYWYLPCDEWARQQLERSKLYWNWFKILWTSHDALLVADQLFSACDCAKRLKDYEWMHDPRSLVNEYKPNSLVLQSLQVKAIL